jgi:hypothetical protein
MPAFDLEITEEGLREIKQHFTNAELTDVDIIEYCIREGVHLNGVTIANKEKK